MYFKVYHKNSKQALATFNERQIVDFCISNKESIKNYYFSSGGEKDLMEWEVFAMKYAELFKKRAQEREQSEESQARQAQALKKDPANKKPLIIIILFLLIILLAGAGYYFFANNKKDSSESIQKTVTGKKIAEDKKQEKKTYPIKRKYRRSDGKFVGRIPKERRLKRLWRRSKKKLKKSLSPAEIKQQMDLYLTDLKNCYELRAEAGDKNLKGIINMRIRVTGDGVVRDVLFVDEKYQSTLFSDCIGKAIKSKKFKMFESKVQVFSYYYNL